jgi:hypothetical protein
MKNESEIRRFIIITMSFCARELFSEAANSLSFELRNYPVATQQLALLEMSIYVQMYWKNY